MRGNSPVNQSVEGVEAPKKVLPTELDDKFDEESDGEAKRVDGAGEEVGTAHVGDDGKGEKGEGNGNDDKDEGPSPSEGVEGQSDDLQNLSKFTSQ